MKVPFLSIAGILIPLVTSIPVLNVDIHVTEDTHGINSQSTSHLQDVLNPTPVTSLAAETKDMIPGWAFIDGDRLRARTHGNTFWNIKGTLDQKFPLDEFLFDPLIFTLKRPDDFAGNFNGTVGQGQISLAWENSGATIIGRSPVGDFEVSGKTLVDYSP
ncbi:hypothetical protein JMJ35_006223 [Cladonia borealis]|uniref:Uncharacterized protein n=1 Tax=Cladonia borealis TaxID=184061 RepID=A0AA39V840_9LECA|nr:hypothetical protein JMJ35_006223 [Cladonia borealis]